MQGTAHCVIASTGQAVMCPSDMAILFLDNADPAHATAYITSPGYDGVSYKIPLRPGIYYPGVSHIKWGTTFYAAGDPVEVIAGRCQVVNLAARVPS